MTYHEPDYYSAEENLKIIIDAINAVRRKGLGVKVSDNSIIVENTVRVAYDLNHKIPVKSDEFAHAEYEFS